MQDLLLQLDSYKSMGHNGIHPRISQRAADVAKKPLSMIFNQSSEAKEVPADWKLETVVPIFKKGKKEDPVNYRPITIQLQFLVKLWTRLFWEVLKNIQKTMQSSVTARTAL